MVIDLTFAMKLALPQSQQATTSSPVTVKFSFLMSSPIAFSSDDSMP